MGRKAHDKTYYEKHKDELRNSPARLAARQRYEAKRCVRDKAERAERRRSRQAVRAAAEKTRRDEWYASEMVRLDAQKEEKREKRRQSRAAYYQNHKSEIRHKQAGYREQRED